MSGTRAVPDLVAAPIGVDGFFQPRRAAFWLMLFFMANGLVSVVGLLFTASRIVPTAVLFGVLAWTLYTVPADSAIFSPAAKLGGPEFAARWGPALAGPPVEETLKVLGVVLLVLVARTQFPTILSVGVTGAMVGLGFRWWRT
ncbi:PrsW family glutamic-type intramembrane protease [Actinosynnema sp. NPDC047251]|uniref:Putative membrane protein n=1 Tax=Saccharothrix espanaensis (strain ATCC 51144 / DSM 44229 / JCM 9112 / NBRC 15066 / NRRL 15764) TaxID=1179773 RepID=K0JZR2_SACES|nr:PrsW family glutamic-type intramembrane protease [Saccharothrix espanaensis]CCH30129.1 putative membrane protein [Saccharothrix espanaensis DSM 44229]